jgi:beta-lactamase class A
MNFLHNLFIKKRTLLLAIAIFCCGLIIGGLIIHFQDKTNAVNANNNQLRLGAIRLINPLLTCGDTHDKNFFEKLKPLDSIIERGINNEINNGDADKISLYFRELNTGQWTGVGENDNYIPASLTKLPLMMAYFRIAEDKPNILTNRFTYNGGTDENANQVVDVPPDSLQKGRSYTIAELINRMIINSDNNSYEILLRLINPVVLEKVYTDLDLSFTPQAPNVAWISPKSFSTFFRILYNASYLGREMSERALELLNKSTFKDGIVAGVPEDVGVAHKFGERTVTNGGTLDYRELHDCGIVYYPNNPYLLCVMTQGKDFSRLESAIKNLSALVYGEVKKQNR